MKDFKKISYSIKFHQQLLIKNGNKKKLKHSDPDIPEPCLTAMIL